jgi:hypothetical protein
LEKKPTSLNLVGFCYRVTKAGIFRTYKDFNFEKHKHWELEKCKRPVIISVLSGVVLNLKCLDVPKRGERAGQVWILWGGGGLYTSNTAKVSAFWLVSWEFYIWCNWMGTSLHICWIPSISEHMWTIWDAFVNGLMLLE